MEISTVVPKNSDNAVAEAPIIWFMASRIALALISSITNSSSGISAPIIIETMTRTSFREKSITLFPLSPFTYEISTPTAGSKSWKSKSSFVSTCTIGVVMFTFVPRSVDTAVADEPRLIFIISPMASNSISLKLVALIYHTPLFSLKIQSSSYLIYFPMSKALCAMVFIAFRAVTFAS